MHILDLHFGMCVKKFRIFYGLVTEAFTRNFDPFCFTKFHKVNYEISLLGVLGYGKYLTARI